jgi:preprotein translocase subunit SecG
MSEDKKNEFTDYSNFFEQERKKTETEEISSIKEKRSFLNNLKSFWEEADKKTKTQIIIFLITIFLTIIILSSYFSKSESKTPQYLQSAEEQFIPGEEEFK